MELLIGMLIFGFPIIIAIIWEIVKFPVELPYMTRIIKANTVKERMEWEDTYKKTFPKGFAYFMRHVEEGRYPHIRSKY